MGGLVKEEDWVKVLLTAWIATATTFFSVVGVNLNDFATVKFFIYSFVVLSFLIANVYFMCALFLKEKTKLEFLRTEMEQRNGEVRFVYYFKNNTKEIISVRMSEFEVIFNGNPLMKKTTLIYNWTVKPIREEQRFEIDWCPPERWNIKYDGEYVVNTEVKYKHKGQWKKLSSTYSFNWERRN